MRLNRHRRIALPRRIKSTATTNIDSSHTSSKTDTIHSSKSSSTSTKSIFPRWARIMNDTTLPKPSSSSSSSKTKNSASARKKAGRFGMAEWNRLVSSAHDLAQRRGQPLRRIRWSEIRQHNTVADGWVVLKGKVYFLSPYLAYHPGGEAILKKVLGKDITDLYEKYHRWVNEERLIGSLLIGYLDTSPTDEEDYDDEEEEKSSYLPQAVKTKDGFAVPAPRPAPRPSQPIVSLLLDKASQLEDVVKRENDGDGDQQTPGKASKTKDAKESVKDADQQMPNKSSDTKEAEKEKQVDQQMSSKESKPPKDAEQEKNVDQHMSDKASETKDAEKEVKEKCDGDRDDEQKTKVKESETKDAKENEATS